MEGGTTSKMRRSNSISSKGLSLAETMLVMMLVMLLMGLMAGLVKEYSDILQAGRSQTARVELFHNVLTKMAAEATEAFQVTVSGAEPFQTLTLKRLNPDPTRQKERLSETRLKNMHWSPFHDADMIEVQYSLRGDGRIMRTVGNKSFEIARDVSALKIKKPDEFTLLVNLTTIEEHTVKTISTLVYLLAETQR